MNYDKDIRWIKAATVAAKPGRDRADWIERYMRDEQCSLADARDAHQMAEWLGKLDNS
jgi:hypothetical protein